MRSRLCPEERNSRRVAAILWIRFAATIEAMKIHPHIRQVAWMIGFVTAVGWASAYADIYTWVDPSGNVNLSNRPPPEGARVTNVFREDPAARASAEAARAAAQREELRALSDRVKQLERDLDAANERPAPAPIVYPPPMPAPAPYPPVVTQTIVVPNAPTYPTYASTYGDCSDPWSSCFSPGYFGFYPGVVVLSAPRSHRPNQGHRGQRVPTRPFMPVQTLPGAPTGPLDLFPGSRRR